MELGFRILDGGRQRTEGLLDFRNRGKKIGYRLFMPIKGGAELVLDGARRHLHPGQIYFVPEISLQIQRCRAGADMYWLSCIANTLELQHSLSCLAGCNELPAKINPYGPGVFEDLDRLFKKTGRRKRERDELKIGTHCRLNALLLHIVARLLEDAEASMPAHEDNLDTKISVAISYIDSNITRKLKIEDIVARAKMSKSALHSKFREVYNTTPINYITERRLSLARQLLSTTDMPVREVARRVGYDNEFYFSRVFKQHLQYSPSEFRRVHSAM
jgi:AraC-like DNA-binding protein